ncbi:MAG: hypothetical protein LQ344_001268 [Seirophora lacunosa]|nr:MAG: hypothetical protein LQ344_001268 [Seirophora lacunosa]
MAFFNTCVRRTCYKLPFEDVEIEVPKPHEPHAVPIYKSSLPEPRSHCNLETAGLQERLQYVEHMRQRKGARKVSERTMAFLNRFKDQCTQAMSMSKGKKKDELLARISVDDGMLQSVHEKIQGPQGLCQMIVQSLNAMREIRNCAQFGDYAAYSLLDLKKSSLGMDPMIWRQPEHLEKDWQQVNKMIEEDEHRVQQYMYYKSSPLERDRPRTPWLDDVARAATALGLEMDTIRWEIKMYAQRNSMCHSGVKRLIEERRWEKLAEEICRDKASLERSFPNDPRGQTQMRVMIGHIQDRFFETCHYHGGEVQFRLSEEAMRMDELAYKRERERKRLRDKQRQGVQP